MKKIVSLILAALMLLSMTACGSKPADVRGEVQTAATEAPKTTEAQPSAEAEPETTEAAEAEEDVQLGTTASNTYTNKFLKLSCTLDSDWVFYSDEEIREINQIAQDALGEKYAEQVKKADSLQDMYAANYENGCTLNITMSRIGAMGLVLTPDTYADAAMPQLAPALESAGMTDVKIEKGTVEFAGETATALFIQTTNQGYPFFETMVILERGGYIVCITSASYIEDTTMDALNAFTKI